MKFPVVSTVLSAAGMSSYALAVVVLPVARGPEYNPEIRPRYLSSRSTIAATLTSNLTRGSYYVDVQVGTPPQPQTLFLDTGSSDVWLLSSDADLCSDAKIQVTHGGCGSTFTSSSSSTFKIVQQGQFNISYLDQTGATGDYVSDTLSIGGATIKSLEMGLASKATIGSGLMGVGYTANEASNSEKHVAVPFEYPSVLDTMVSESLIAGRAYSLYLNSLESSKGSIIFGGLDTHKFSGSLVQLPVVQSNYPNGTEVYGELTVTMSSFSTTDKNGNTTTLTSSGFEETVLLDSGTTFSYLSETLAKKIYKSIEAVDDSAKSGFILADCSLLQTSSAMTFDFGFTAGSSQVTIKVPLSELLFPLDTLLDLKASDIPNKPWPSTCAFSIYISTSANSVLGDSFLRSSYAVYDLDNNFVALAQANFNSTSSSIVEFQAGATDLPQVTGVKDSPSTATPTGSASSSGTGANTSAGASAPANGNGNGNGSAKGSGTAGGSAIAKATGSGSATGPASTSHSQSAAVGSVPAFDMSRLITLSISSVFVIMGSAWFVAL